MSEKSLFVSLSPHINAKHSTQSIMLDVIIALSPAAILSIIFFGLKALFLIIVCIVFAVAAEAGIQKFFKRKITISDLSAVVTGLLLALNLPINAPWWVGAVGSVFAIIVIKQLFGGIGFNFANPALAARVMLVVSWPAHMTGAAYLPTDAISSATPLAILGGEASGQLPSLLQMLIGNGIYGCIGEVSSLALIAGGIYLVFRKVIAPTIPCVYAGVVALFSLIAGRGFEGAAYQLLAGGLMLGAIFMATDYVTSPMTKPGMAVYAAGCGLITCIIRFYGGYAEGVMFSILLMNLLTPLIDKYVRAKAFGVEKKEKGVKQDA